MVGTNPAGAANPVAPSPVAAKPADGATVSARAGALPTDISARDIYSALERFTDPQGNPVALLRGLIDAIRPANARDSAAAILNWRAMNAALAANDAYRRAVGGKVLELLATRRLLSFFSEEGILPPTGFFSELWRKIVHKVLPEVRDERVFKDCLVLIFHRSTDYLWFNAVSIEDKLEFWNHLDWRHSPSRGQVDAVDEELLDALLVVAHRTAALAFHPEMRRVCPEVDDPRSPFLALHRELSHFVDQFRSDRAGLDRAGVDRAGLGRACDPTANAARFAKLMTLCRMQLSQAYVATLVRGVRLSLTYLLTRFEQHLDRLDLLHGLLSQRGRTETDARLKGDVDGFVRATAIGESQRNSVRKHFSDLIGLLALRVTESASRTGEHYITSDAPGLRALWRSAMGAGLVFAFLALGKLYAHELSLTPLAYGVVSSLIYGLGFMFIALAHGTIATKQPAMTAANIANVIHISNGEVGQVEELVTLIVDTLRSQVAAILGNVSVVMITAAAIAWAYAAWFGHPVVDDHEAGYLLGQLNPVGPLPFYAAITGVWLFLSGLIDGYFDNLATYARLGERIGSLRWLAAIIGTARAQRFGAFVDRRLGTVMGNLLFGCMLGMTGVVGAMFGLPIDTLHVAFSAGYLAFGVAGLEDISAGVVAQASLGVALIGFFNLAVSFTLALYTALRSRGATFASAPSLAAQVGQRIVKNPLRLLIPPP